MSGPMETLAALLGNDSEAGRLWAAHIGGDAFCSTAAVVAKVFDVDLSVVRATLCCYVTYRKRDKDAKNNPSVDAAVCQEWVSLVDVSALELSGKGGLKQTLEEASQYLDDLTKPGVSVVVPKALQEAFIAHVRVARDVVRLSQARKTAEKKARKAKLSLPSHSPQLSYDTSSPAASAFIEIGRHLRGTLSSVRDCLPDTHATPRNRWLPLSFFRTLLGRRGGHGLPIAFPSSLLPIQYVLWANDLLLHPPSQQDNPHQTPKNAGQPPSVARQQHAATLIQATYRGSAQRARFKEQKVQHRAAVANMQPSSVNPPFAASIATTCPFSTRSLARHEARVRARTLALTQPAPEPGFHETSWHDQNLQPQGLAPWNAQYKQPQAFAAECIYQDGGVSQPRSVSGESVAGQPMGRYAVHRFDDEQHPHVNNASHGGTVSPPPPFVASPPSVHTTVLSPGGYYPGTSPPHLPDGLPQVIVGSPLFQSPIPHQAHGAHGGVTPPIMPSPFSGSTQEYYQGHRLSPDGVQREEETYVDHANDLEFRLLGLLQSGERLREELANQRVRGTHGLASQSPLRFATPACTRAGTPGQSMLVATPTPCNQSVPRYHATSVPVFPARRPPGDVPMPIPAFCRPAAHVSSSIWNDPSEKDTLLGGKRKGSLKQSGAAKSRPLEFQHADARRDSRSSSYSSIVSSLGTRRRKEAGDKTPLSINTQLANQSSEQYKSVLSSRRKPLQDTHDNTHDTSLPHAYTSAVSSIHRYASDASFRSVPSPSRGPISPILERRYASRGRPRGAMSPVMLPQAASPMRRLSAPAVQKLPESFASTARRSSLARRTSVPHQELTLSDASLQRFRMPEVQFSAIRPSGGVPSTPSSPPTPTLPPGRRRDY